MKKTFLITLCVLFLLSTTVFATTYSYTISGKVRSAGVGVANAGVAHYTTWSSGVETGGGIGPTALDGSFSHTYTGSTESYINKSMRLSASKGQMSGSKNWTCAASSEIKDVDIYFNVAVDPDLHYGGEPIHFSGSTLVAPSTQYAYIEPGYSGETQLQSFTVQLAYDPTQMNTSEPAVSPAHPYMVFTPLILAPGLLQVHAEVDLGGPLLMLGDSENPLPLYFVEWTATEAEEQYIAEVQTELIEMNLGPIPPGIATQAVANTTQHLVGDAEKCQPGLLLDSATEWQEALDSEWPQESLRPMLESEWEKHMALWSDPCSDKEGEPYIPDCNFVPAEPPGGDLYVYDGNSSSSDPLDPCDAGLVMYWGEPPSDGNYASAFTFDWGNDPDLRNKIIKVTVTPPQFGNGQINAVSFGITDVMGLKRWWWWSCGGPASGAPIIWNQQNTVTIDTSLTGLAAATPTATGYVSAAGFNLAQAQSFDVDENFQWLFPSVTPPPPGQPTFVGMWNYWHNLLITNKTPPVAVTSKYHVKFSQRPDVIDDGDPKYILGWDEVSDFNNQPIVADDWLCEDERPVTDVHWWGSFKNWTQPHLPPVIPSKFHIGIWTDVPAGVDSPHSHPGTLVWENYCDNWVWNFFGYDIDPKEEVENEACFQFNQLLSEDEWFYQDPCEPWEWPVPDQHPNGRVYWLSIAAIYDNTQPPPQYPWGWKTRQPHWNDDAVLIWAIVDPSDQPIWPGATPYIGCSIDMLFDPSSALPIEVPLHPGGDPISWDVSFELTTNEPSPAQPASPDLNFDGVINFRDLAIMANAWATTIP